MFRSTSFDPQLIVAQIITTQALFYVCLGVFFFLVDLTVGEAPRLGSQIFDASNFTLKTGFGIVTVCGNIFAAAVG